jgi:hemoglobin
MRLFVTLGFFAVAGCATASASRLPPPSAQTEEQKPATGAEPKKPLFERLGGKGAIEAVVDDFLGRVAHDERINSGFAVGSVPRVRQRLVELVCAGTGGPCTYSGRDMKSAHAGMAITGAQFDALVGHLVASLDKFKVPAQEKGDLLAILGPMRSAIVEEP